VLRGISDEISLQEALGTGAKLSLSVVSIANEAKTQWFSVRVLLQSSCGKWSWCTPRSYASFQHLSKSLQGSVTNNDLPKLKPSVAEPERVIVMNAYLMDICNQLSSVPNLSLLRFVDLFDSPSTFGLRLLQPLHEGTLELSAAKGSKPQQYYFILKENLFFFRSSTEECAVGVIALEYVTLEMVVDVTMPRFSFSISNLQKDVLAFLSADSTKSMSEWILKIRRAKFLRTGRFVLFCLFFGGKRFRICF
jgi:hypothetical protein